MASWSGSRWLTLPAILLIIEIGLRLAHPFLRPLRYALWSGDNIDLVQEIDTSDDLIETLPPMYPANSWFMGMRLDPHGFWTPPYDRTRTEGTVRIVILGDSFAYSSGGVPYEQTWHTLTGRGLENAWHRPVETINLGLPGAGPLLEARAFDVAGADLKPDLVLLGLFVGNDLTDNSRSAGLLERASYLARLVGNLGRNLDALKVLWQAPGNGTYELSPRWDAEHYVYDPTRPTFPEDVFLRIEQQRAEIFLEDRRAWRDERIAAVVEVIDALRRRVEAAGGQFVMVMIPDELAVNDDLRRRVSGRIDADAGFVRALRIEEAHRELERELTENGIPCLDLLPVMRAGARQQSPYRPRDTHWNDYGNQLAATAIVDWLVRLEPHGPSRS